MSDIAAKLTAVAENQQKVYDAGYEKGKAEGGDTETAYNNGVEAEYDRFWYNYQQSGLRRSYAGAFFGTGWTNETFKPKYPIAPSSCFEMFRECGEIDLTNVGVTIDFSRSTSFTNFAYTSGITHFGVVNTQSASSLVCAFFKCTKLITIDKLILKPAGTQSIGYQAFQNCSCLENIAIEGVIGDSINFQWSPLTKSSIESVMAALSDTVSGFTATFKKTAVDTAFETAEGLADGSVSEQWLALVAAKENWTVSLV